VHTNHRNEIDEGVASACRRLRQSGATLLNQSVLLDGVNDSTSALAELSAALFEIGVLPYYLHLLDPVVGAMHFAVSDDRALALMAELRAALPGYLVPRLVREIAGEPSKTVIA
jgi:L-lysine 2,3-aminomutase